MSPEQITINTSELFEMAVGVEIRLPEEEHTRTIVFGNHQPFVGGFLLKIKLPMGETTEILVPDQDVCLTETGKFVLSVHRLLGLGERKENAFIGEKLGCEVAFLYHDYITPAYVVGWREADNDIG